MACKTSLLYVADSNIFCYKAMIFIKVRHITFAPPQCQSCRKCLWTTIYERELWRRLRPFRNDLCVMCHVKCHFGSNTVWKQSLDFIMIGVRLSSFKSGIDAKFRRVQMQKRWLNWSPACCHNLSAFESLQDRRLSQAHNFQKSTETLPTKPST